MDNRPFFIRNPKWQIVIGEVFFLILYMVFIDRLGGVENNNRLAIAVDFMVFMAGLLIWPFFFAQFILPVRTVRERFLAFLHLMRYLFGEHGPALHVENGAVVQHDGEMKKRGPGVLIIDAASAAVLRTDVAFTRAVGPGIHFLNFDPGQNSTEYVAGTVDLRVQVRSGGPEDREDPFAARSRQESDADFSLRQERRWETSGLTRDGIEIVPNISAVFRLETRPGEGGAGFGYNPVSVWRAITGEGVDPNLPVDDARRAVSWHWLPLRLAEDVWREYLRMFPMDELFQSAYDEKTARDIIGEMIRLRLTQAKVPELNEFGRPTGRQVTSPEFTLLLRRGLRVLGVSVSNLRLPAQVEEQLNRRWQSTWLKRAQQERDFLEYQRSYARENGQREALRDYALASSQFVGEIPTPGRGEVSTGGIGGVPTQAKEEIRGQGASDAEDSAGDLSGDQILKMLIEGTLLLSVRDPQLHQRFVAEKNELVDIIGWIQNNP